MNAHEKLPVADDDDEGLPSLEAVEAMFAASRHGPLPPWLTPEGLAAAAEAAARGIPELNGPINPDDLPPDDD
jgi:hypothetical protein